jgi:hypothetical protein
MFESLPPEIAETILETVCTQLVDELTNLGGHIEDVHFGAKLGEFRNLLLVSRQFCRLLYARVRVNSSPIREHLIWLQAFALSMFLSFQRDRTPRTRGHYYEGPGLGQLQRTCGNFWNNPRFGEVFPRLFDSNEHYWVNSEVILWCMYQAPLKLTRSNGGASTGLVEGRCYKRVSALRRDGV